MFDNIEGKPAGKIDFMSLIVMQINEIRVMRNMEQTSRYINSVEMFEDLMIIFLDNAYVEEINNFEREYNEQQIRDDLSMGDMPESEISFTQQKIQTRIIERAHFKFSKLMELIQRKRLLPELGDSNGE